MNEHFRGLPYGHVLGVVDGRSSRNVTRWLQERPEVWLDRLEVVANDPVWAQRMLLLRAGDRLATAGLHRFDKVQDYPAYEAVAVAGAVEENLRRILNAQTNAEAHNVRIDFELAVATADLPEAERLSANVVNWWIKIKVFFRTRITNVRNEAANTKIRLLTRTAYGFKSPDALIALAMLSLGGYRPALPGRN